MAFSSLRIKSVVQKIRKQLNLIAIQQIKVYKFLKELLKVMFSQFHSSFLCCASKILIQLLQTSRQLLSNKCTLLSRIIVPGRLFFFGIFFHPGCLIRDSPLIKITKFYPGRMPNRYSPFIFFKDFQLHPNNFFLFTKINTSVLSRNVS